MRIYFSPRVTIIGLVLSGLMIRASFWQLDRYHQKLSYIETLQSRLALPPVPINELLEKSAPELEQYTHRLVTVSGTYDFANEVVLRNRRHDTMPGVFAITPMTIAGTDRHVLVNRGFIPLSRSALDERREFQKPDTATFVGLVKASQTPRFLAPNDPPVGGGAPRLDAWLYVNIEAMAKQLPYPVLPVFLEIYEAPDAKSAASQMIAAKSGRDDIFLPSEGNPVAGPDDVKDNVHYPIPVFDTVVPAGRHREYVFEWAFMALLTVLICLVLQLRPRRAQIEAK